MSIEYGFPFFPKKKEEEKPKLSDPLKKSTESGTWWRGSPEMVGLYMLDLQKKNPDSICYSEIVNLNPITGTYGEEDFNYSYAVTFEYYPKYPRPYLNPNGFDKLCDLKKRFKIAPFILYGKDLTAHCNALIFDSHCQTLLRFEPHGKKVERNSVFERTENRIDESLRSLASTMNAKYVAPRDYEPDVLQDAEPLCAAFSLMFLEYIVEFSKEDSCPNIIVLAKHICSLITEEKVIKYAANIRSNARYAELWDEIGNFDYPLAKQRIYERSMGIDKNTARVTEQFLTVKNNELEAVKQSLESEKKLNKIISSQLETQKKALTIANQLQELDKNQLVAKNSLIESLSKQIENQKKITDLKGKMLDLCEHPPSILSNIKDAFKRRSNSQSPPRSAPQQ